VTFTETVLAGAFVVDPEPRADERGWFARTWCQREAVALGLNPRVVQCSVSVNRRRGTLRGLHYQAAPWAEVKLVRCTRGAIHDVIVDLRPYSPTYMQHVAVALSADNHRALYVPEGFAHGFQTLVDDTEVVYQMSEFYAPEHGRGIRWNDPAFGIRWPEPSPILSPRDAALPDWPAAVEVRA
jgi:dTDP-4-dehydrorhamnose 3,5-epimerase